MQTTAVVQAYAVLHNLSNNSVTADKMHYLLTVGILQIQEIFKMSKNINNLLGLVITYTTEPHKCRQILIQSYVCLSCFKVYMPF